MSSSTLPIKVTKRSWEGGREDEALATGAAAEKTAGGPVSSVILSAKFANCSNVISGWEAKMT